jgi:hypothetical protein
MVKFLFTRMRRKVPAIDIIVYGNFRIPIGNKSGGIPKCPHSASIGFSWYKGLPSNLKI